MATITSLMFRMNSTYNGEGLTRARRDIAQLDSSMNALEKSSGKLVPGFKALVSSIIMLGPALIPLAGGLLGVGAAASSAFASAGGAIAIYGLAMKGAIQSTVGQGSAVASTASKMQTAQKALDNSVKGTKQYETAQKALTTAVKAHEAAIKELPPAQEAFARAYDNSKTAVQDFNTENAKFTLRPATTMLNAFMDALPKFAGLLKAVEPEVQRVADATKRWVNEGGLDRFLKFLITYGVPALHGFISAGQSLFKALGIGLRTMAPLGQGFVDWLQKTMDAFARWASNGGFERFLQWLADNKGALLGIAKDLGTTMGNLGKALGDMSGLALTNVGVLLKILASFPPGLIEALAYAWVAWNAALTVYNVVAFIAAAATTVLSLAAAPFGLLMIGAAVTIGLVILALVALGVAIFFLVKYWDTIWKAIKSTAKTVWDWLVTAWDYLWSAIKDTAVAVWDWLTHGWGQLALFFMGPIGLFILVWKHWDVIWGGIKATALAVWDWLKSAWSTTVGAILDAWNAVTGPIRDSWNKIWPELKDAAMNVWAALSAAWNVLWTVMKTIWDAFWGTFGGTFKTAWSGLTATATATWKFLTDAWALVWAVIQGVFSTAWAVLSGAWSVGWSVLTGTAQIAWAVLTGAWKVIWSVVTGIWNTFYATFSAIFSGAWQVIVAIATGIWNVIKAAWNALWDVVTAIFLTFLAIFTGHWGKAWTAIQQAAQSIWNVITTAWNAFLNVLTTALQAFVGVIQAVWNAFWAAVQNTAQTFWNAIKNLFSVTLTAIQNLWNTVWNAVKTIFQTVVNAIVSIATAWWSAFRSGINAFLTAVQSAWSTVWSAIRSFFTGVVNGLVTTATGLWNTIRTIFSAGSTWLLNTFWNPVSNFFTKTIPGAFDAGAKALGTAWDKIKKLVRDPIQAVVNVVYNNGIVKLWNAVAGVFGASKLSSFNLPAFKKGGPTGSGSSQGFAAIVHPGEHVWTAEEVRAAGGHEDVAKLRALALDRSSHRIRVMGTADQTYDDGGGIFGKIGGAIGGVTSAIGGAIGDVVGKLKDVVLGGVYKVISGPVHAAVSAAQAAVRGLTPAGSGIRDLGEAIPKKVGDTVLSWIKNKDVSPDGGGGPVAGGSVKAALAWARTQAGKPYVWGGVGPGGYDCSGFMSAIENVIQGRNPYRRLWATGAFSGGSAPSGWKRSATAPFMVGITNAGVGHTAGTLNGVNVESRGGQGVVIGSSARGAHNGLFTSWYGYTPSIPKGGYANGTPGANSGWATVGERGLERVRFRGGERVDPLNDLVSNSSGGDTYVQVDIDARGATAAAVDKLNQEFPDTLRVALASGVGRKP